jgi:hypothetical protein
MTSNHGEARRWMARALTWEQTLVRLRGEVSRRVVPVRRDRRDEAVEPRASDDVRSAEQPKRSARRNNRVA